MNDFLLDGHLLADHGDGGLDRVVDVLLDGLQFLGGALPVEVEVESEPLGGDVGSLLLDVGADNLPQRGVQQVSRCVQLGGLDGVVGQTALELLVGAHPRVLLVGLESLLEVVDVDLLPLLRGKLLGQLHGEPEGVVEPEHHVAGEGLRVACLGDHLVEPPQSLDQRLVELLLLGGDVAVDEVLVPL